MLAAVRSGALVVSRFSVTVPLVPPPVRAVPAVTPVIVPVPLTVAHTQALPFHCSTCLLEQFVCRLRLNVPLVPPPVSPLPLPVVIPVIELPPEAYTMSSSAG